MRNLRVTINATTGVPVPTPADGTVFGPFAGFRFTLTAPSGATGSPPVENKLVWLLSGLVEGATYHLLVEAVDEAGRVMASLSQPIEVPVTDPSPATFTRPESLSLEWLPATP